MDKQTSHKQPQLVRVHSEDTLGTYTHRTADFKSNIPFPQLVSRQHHHHKTEFKEKLQEMPPSVPEQEETDKNDQKHKDSAKKLPHYTVFDDKKQFNQKPRRRERCNSVGELKTVKEEKRQSDAKEICKLYNLIDKGEFNNKHVPDRQVQVMDDVKNITAINYHEDIEPIKEIEEPKEQPEPQKTPLQQSIEHIVADEVDQIDKKKREDDEQEPVVPIIQENEEQGAIESLEKAKDKLLLRGQSLTKHVHSQPLSPQITQLKRQNLKPYAMPIVEQES